ncbi:hypothetical protein LRAMOSA07711 [Lichtheimia ramosa]|uniref:non-specific serine/threonine protein kinase n=1 Tax=Lichtheimia ramosa TaxID=688394 RepID=A0A077WEX7_9FUNG|nr:hypothetical protein LRAMOSA07711 [Lichtheimia ramosa]
MLSTPKTSAQQLDQLLHSHSNALLDCIVAIYKDAKALPEIPPFLKQFEPIYNDIARLRINKDDFEHIRPLARGQFAQVSIVRSRLDNQVYAMKTLNKCHMLAQRERASFMEERQVLSQANTEWIPSLHAAFQDDDHLYLVMEYAAGGDLFSILDRKESLCLSEKEARFYIAETILAVDSLHQLGYLHRDIKPQNILIDSTGHVKLADFGSCIAMTSVTSDNNSNKEMLLPVGTCDYVSPEVLQCTSAYGTEVDWWSVGIVLYEALQQNPPFHSDKSEKDTYLNIMFHKSIEFPRPVSPACRDLIQRLLSKRETRLNNVDEIKAHPFFNGIDWDRLRSSTPPFRPILASPDDTSNFSVLDDDNTMDHDDIMWKNVDHIKHLPFIGFSYQPNKQQAANKKSASLGLERVMEQMETRIKRLPLEDDVHEFESAKVSTGKCEYCQDKLWGPRALVCRACQYQCHPSCQQYITGKCSSSRRPKSFSS